MKLNWGLGIAIFYGSFMAILLFFVIRSTQYDHSLVASNYYEQDLNYQKHYEKIENANAHSKNFVIETMPGENLVNIRFLVENAKVSGSLGFFRPSDQSLDISMPLKLDGNQEMQVSTAALQTGHWVLQMDWVEDGKAYYFEKEIYR